MSIIIISPLFDHFKTARKPIGFLTKNNVNSSEILKLLAEATKMAKIGEFNLSLELSKQVLAIDLNNVDALLISGRCFAMLGQNNKAIKALEKLTIVQPENIEVYNLLGHLFLNVYKPDLAIDAFNRCLELNPKHV